MEDTCDESCPSCNLYVKQTHWSGDLVIMINLFAMKQINEAEK